VLDRRTFRPCAVAAALLLELWRADPERFAWRQPPYEYEHDKLPFDILSGSNVLREQIEAQVPLPDITTGWANDLEEFRRVRQSFLLY
jgi:uncharacterized protein YbbC (DUF1343 family)